jgi:uncharacterized protein (DUF58 family)
MILPELDELVALRGAAHGLTLHARRPVLARIHGAHRSAQRGRGLEFEEVRLYAAGDDARNIDWRVTARRGKPHTKLFREERERPVWLLADLDRGLYFGSRRQLKSALLLRAAALLAWVAVAGGDRLGALIGDGESAPRIFAPRAREAGVLPVLEALIEMQPRRPGASAAGHLAAALHALRPLLQPGSLIFVLSDFSDLDAAAEAALAGLSLHHDCRLLWLSDVLERSGLPGGQYRVGLPERLWWLDGNASRARWLDAWQTRERRLDDVSQRLRLPLTRLDTADAIADSLPQLLRETVQPKNRS